MRKTIGVAAGLSLLTLQLTGLHIHADEEGFVGMPETAYSHSHAHDHDDAHHFGESDAHHADGGGGARDHDYDDAQDVSLFDLAASSLKLPMALLALAFLCVVLPRIPTLIGAAVIYPVLSGRHTRWRPPLRAPPKLLTI